MKKAFALAALLGLTGCAALSSDSARPFEAEFAPAGLQFSSAPAIAPAGGVSDLALRNGAAVPVGYNLCIAALEQFEGGLWVPARAIGLSCPQSFQSLAPGETATAQAALPATLEPGVYRFVTQLSASSENLPDVQLRGEPFRVE